MTVKFALSLNLPADNNGENLLIGGIFSYLYSILLTCVWLYFNLYCHYKLGILDKNTLIRKITIHVQPNKSNLEVLIKNILLMTKTYIFIPALPRTFKKVANVKRIKLAFFLILSNWCCSPILIKLRSTQLSVSCIHQIHNV